MTLINTAIDLTAREITLRQVLGARLGRRRCGFCTLTYANRLGVTRDGTWFCAGDCARARKRPLTGDALLASIFRNRPRREPEVAIPSPAEQAENARRYRRARETERLLAAWDRGEVSASELA